MTSFLFPGQGSQSVGMSKDFHDNFKAAKLVFDASQFVSTNPGIAVTSQNSFASVPFFFANPLHYSHSLL